MRLRVLQNKLQSYEQELQQTFSQIGRVLAIISNLQPAMMLVTTGLWTVGRTEAAIHTPAAELPCETPITAAGGSNGKLAMVGESGVAFLDDGVWTKIELPPLDPVVNKTIAAISTSDQLVVVKETTHFATAYRCCQRRSTTSD